MTVVLSLKLCQIPHYNLNTSSFCLPLSPPRLLPPPQFHSQQTRRQKVPQIFTKTPRTTKYWEYKDENTKIYTYTHYNYWKKIRNSVTRFIKHFVNIGKNHLSRLDFQTNITSSSSINRWEDVNWKIKQIAASSKLKYLQKETICAGVIYLPK